MAIFNFKKKEQGVFYSLDNILELGAHYNLIYGERSAGKTFAVLEYAIRRYWAGQGRLGYVRRWDSDVTGASAKQVFDGLVSANKIEEITKGKYNNVYFYSNKWYLCRYDENGKVDKDANPFAHAFAINLEEHYKGGNYMGADMSEAITTILFDEFIARDRYLNDEFVKFNSILSTIIRHRPLGEVTIFMCGNTINRYCPYFREMGLKHCADMKPGTIDMYDYGEGKLKVAVEHTAPNTEGKPSDEYFAFDNPKLLMITDSMWETSIYPHSPRKYLPKDVIFTYFIDFDERLLQCEVISVDNDVYTFIHKKTTPIQDEDYDLVFTMDYRPRPNYRRNILKPMDDAGKRIKWFFDNDKVFYQDNEVGEHIRNYLNVCLTEK